MTHPPNPTKPYYLCGDSGVHEPHHGCPGLTEQQVRPPRHVVACPQCGSRDEYDRPDPPEYTCGHWSWERSLAACARLADLASQAYARASQTAAQAGAAFGDLLDRIKELQERDRG
jgi:hypothetical protein